MALSILNGVLESLEWESAFFCASLSDSASARQMPPALQDADFSAWQRVQAKIPADRADLLDALQQHGFRLVEGEVDLSVTVALHASPGAEIATEQDIPTLRKMAALAFAQSRFRAPWYAPDDSGRFYAQWIENAVKGTFDHVCLVFRTDGGQIQGLFRFEAHRHEARIGLLAGHVHGRNSCKRRCTGAEQQQVSTLRVAQMGNTAALNVILRVVPASTPPPTGYTGDKMIPFNASRCGH